MVTTPFGYGCSGYKNDKSGCNFNIGEIAGKELSEEQVKNLIEKGVTETIRGFKSKAGKRFDACLRMKKDEETGKVSAVFDFDHVEPQKLDDLSCPVCGGDIIVTPYGYSCCNHKYGEEGSCSFSVGKIAEKSLSEAQLRQLIVEKHTDTIRGFKSKKGKKFDACLKLEKDEEGKISIVFDFDNVEAKKVKDVKCPLCGGDIVVTAFGYGCANYRYGDETSCRFAIGKMADKSLTEKQVKQLLTEGRTETIYGFKSKNGKKFDGRIALRKEDDKITGLMFDFEDLENKKVKDVKCPVCGGAIEARPFGFACENYKKEGDANCTFAVGRIASVKIKEQQLKQLLINGKTDVIEGFVAKTGMKFDAPLKLGKDGNVEFDFPEKPKPVDTEVICPKCGQYMKKSQWQYECGCGFKVWHTVAGVPLTDALTNELFQTGKTKYKVEGFQSKTGNLFDACLKFENDSILFDFDNPGVPKEPEEDKKETSEPEQTEDQNVLDTLENKEQ